MPATTAAAATDAAQLPAELVRLVDAACSYAELYRAELEDGPDGGTSRELLDAVAAWRASARPGPSPS